LQHRFWLLSLLKANTRPILFFYLIRYVAFLRFNICDIYNKFCCISQYCFDIVNNHKPDQACPTDDNLWGAI